MTKCGHIYCWSCINRYLGMAQKGWRKCPICFDSVSTKRLKSTSIELVPEYHEGDSIKFTLMRRHKDCTVPQPSIAHGFSAAYHPTHFIDSSSTFPTTQGGAAFGTLEADGSAAASRRPRFEL